MNESILCIFVSIYLSIYLISFLWVSCLNYIGYLLCVVHIKSCILFLFQYVIYDSLSIFR